MVYPSQHMLKNIFHPFSGHFRISLRNLSSITSTKWFWKRLIGFIKEKVLNYKNQTFVSSMDWTIILKSKVCLSINRGLNGSQNRLYRARGGDVPCSRKETHCPISSRKWKFCVARIAPIPQPACISLEYKVSVEKPSKFRVFEVVSDSFTKVLVR